MNKTKNDKTTKIKTIITSKCLDCEYCTVDKQSTALIKIICNAHNKIYNYGQRVECNEYKKVVNEINE